MPLFAYTPWHKVIGTLLQCCEIHYNFLKSSIKQKVLQLVSCLWMYARGFKHRILNFLSLNNLKRNVTKH